MCTVCIDDGSSVFVFPQEPETIDKWLERIGAHEQLQLAYMFHSDHGLRTIAESYELQGFTYQSHFALENNKKRPWFNVLYIRDLVFVTYGEIFSRLQGWQRHIHDD
jgi:hypothetical protein